MSKTKKKIQRILEVLRQDKSELSVIFSDDEYIKKLNKKYRDIDKATDVLSFPQAEGPFASIQTWVLGDVVISAEWACREAQKRDHPLESEIDFLLIHGILHLLGFDHEKSQQEREKMEKKERDLLASLLNAGS